MCRKKSCYDFSGTGEVHPQELPATKSGIKNESHGPGESEVVKIVRQQLRDMQRSLSEKIREFAETRARDQQHLDSIIKVISRIYSNFKSLKVNFCLPSLDFRFCNQKNFSVNLFQQVDFLESMLVDAAASSSLEPEVQPGYSGSSQSRRSRNMESVPDVQQHRRSVNMVDNTINLSSSSEEDSS